MQSSSRCAAQQHRALHVHVRTMGCNTPVNRPARRQQPHGCMALPDGSKNDLSSQFATFMLRAGVPQQPITKPSPLLPPHAVVAAQLDALQRNNYPEHNAGINTAFSFAKPQELHQQADSQLQSLPTGLHRAWGAAEQWLSLTDFTAQFAQPPFNVLLDCDSWKAASSVLFTGNRNTSSRAVQVVHVHAAAMSADMQPANGPLGNLATDASPGSPSSPALRTYTFSFCLEQIQTGPAKGVWYTVGVRVGDYSV